MKELLEGRFAPLTFKIGFLECSLDVVSEAYLRWTQPQFKEVVREAVAGGLEDALHLLEPLTTPPRREVLLTTDSRWTAYFDNGVHGCDPFTPISYLSEQLGCRGLIATCIPHTLKTETGKGKGTYGAIQFELLGPVQKEFLNYERSISVAYEGGKWHFDATGTIQPYEEVSQYAARRIVDRFTPEMLERYCQALGVRLMDESFYTGPGTLILIRDSLPGGSREFTLAEARREIALA
jgi:hypothetical protein